MKRIKKNKGFTLVELIVVIAIIGILAAVLIPSISGYITKAHRGRDVELAGHMTTELTLYATEFNVNLDNLTGVDVRTILAFSGQTMVPRKDKWVFVYDRTTHQVVVKDLDKNGVVVFAAAPADPVDPTHIEENYFLVSKGKTQLEKAVDLMTNLKTAADYSRATTLLAGSSYLTIIQKFDPATTMFISNGEAYTTAAVDGGVTKVVILEKTSSLPNIDTATFNKLNATLKAGSSILSNTIRTSEPGSPLKGLFQGVQDIDLSKVKVIDLAAFGTNATNNTIYKMEMGPHFKNSAAQVIDDKIIAIIPKGDTELIINRKLTVSYYNKDGLFAQGSIMYAILQNK